MSRSMWDHYGSSRWRVGNTNWLVDGRKVEDDGEPWIAMSPHDTNREVETFATHAEAITYAQEHAKTQALKEPS